jgi:hypothetical protein
MCDAQSFVIGHDTSKHLNNYDPYRARQEPRPPAGYGFLGTILAGQPAEPEFVHPRFREDPACARTCGSTIEPLRQN